MLNFTHLENETRKIWKIEKMREKMWIFSKKSSPIRVFTLFTSSGAFFFLFFSARSFQASATSPAGGAQRFVSYIVFIVCFFLFR
ncbi:MAG: hypothetical protein ABJ059_00420, partial [Hyphomicrobiales bacterium]